MLAREPERSVESAAHIHTVAERTAVNSRIVAISCWIGLCALASTGCDSPRIAPRGADNLDLHKGRLSQVNPLDIAVVPIQNSTGIDSLPLDSMRRAFFNGLVHQRYSPLSLDYVDKKVVNASYSPGELQENAVFQFVLTKWDDSRWATASEIAIDGEVYLLDVAHPDPTQALWGGKVSRRVSVLNLRDSVATDGEALERAVQRFADDVLASLPTRDPERTTSTR